MEFHISIKINIPLFQLSIIPFFQQSLVKILVPQKYYFLPKEKKYFAREFRVQHFSDSGLFRFGLFDMFKHSFKSNFKPNGVAVWIFCYIFLQGFQVDPVIIICFV